MNMTVQQTGRAKLEEIKRELHLGGYVYQNDDRTPKLYNSKGDVLYSIPFSTADRLASENEFRVFNKPWGDNGRYIGREGSSGHFNYLINRAHCKHIADDIDDYVCGRVVRCPECGGLITIDDDREKHLCRCGYIDDVDEFETLGIYDYLEDVYDIEYRIGSDKQLRSVQLMVACGGPNIYIDTASKQVELYWWGDRADWSLSSEAVESIDEWAEEYYAY